jgi:hypothetical protein
VPFLAGSVAHATFAADVPAGNHGVTIALGDDAESADVWIQFGHNDDVRGWYLRVSIAGIREKGGHPVLVTSIPGNCSKMAE